MTVILSPQLREYLPRKWNETIASEYNVSGEYVRRVFRGELKYSPKTTEITQSIIALAESHKASAEALIREMQERQQNLFESNEY